MMRLAGFDDDLPVDGNQLNARTGLVRLLVGGAVANDGRVEDDEVGKGPFADDTPAGEAKSLGRSAAELVDGVFQGKQPRIPHQGAEQPTRGAVDSRMQARRLGMIDAVASHQV